MTSVDHPDRCHHSDLPRSCRCCRSVLQRLTSRGAEDARNLLRLDPRCPRSQPKALAFRLDECAELGRRAARVKSHQFL